MTPFVKRSLVSMLAGAVLLFLGACASVPASSPRVDIDQMVRAARSKSDHEAIAAYFADQAGELGVRAQEHDAVARSYTPFTLSTNDGIWMRHCVAQTAKLRSAADESAALADVHRDAAASLAD